MKRGLSIRYLLLLANAFILLVPAAAVVFLHLWDGHLVRITEQQLIAESVLIAEAWRDRLRDAGGAPQPADNGDAPIEPVLDLNYGVQPPAPEPQRVTTERDGPEWRAGAQVQPLMERAQLTNLSAARIVDRHGCVVATTGNDLGACIDDRPEVQAALAGRYDAVARRRISDAPLPPLTSSSRRGTVRVFTALPVREAGRIIGAVYLSRTSSSPLEVVWNQRYTVLLALSVCLLLMAGVTLVLSRAISRPVRTITAAAESVARGEPAAHFTAGGMVPAEIDALREALARMTAQLTDRATYIAGFAANVSHELKTPLTGIRGAVELLRDEWDGMPESQRRRFLHNIEADATRMERLVTRLLQLARIQSAPDAAETIEVAPFFARVAERYGNRVVVDTTGGPVTIVMNPDHLETAVRNLLDNAVRHGAGTPVDLTVRGVDHQTVVSVRDRGPGISVGNRARIFDRFFTTERDRGGTGLGLAIVRAVAETRGGRVTFETGPEGTTFTLTV